MNDVDWQQVAALLNAHLTRKRMSSQQVATKAGIDRKTIDRLRSGQAVRPQTLQWIEQALKISFRQESAELATDVAPAAVGGYRRDQSADLEGHYLCYRRSFDHPGQVVASHLRIFWDDGLRHLRFHEAQHNRSRTGEAYEYRFDGDVHLPPNLGIVQFVARSPGGLVRLLTTSMPRMQHGHVLLKGLLLTLNELGDIGYYPATSPIVMKRLATVPTGDALLEMTGVLEDPHEAHGWASRLLTEVTRKFAPGSTGG